MEQKGLLSSLSSKLGFQLSQPLTNRVGSGSGSGSGLDSLSAEKIEVELSRLVADGKDFNVSFDSFPYYVSEQTKVLLTSAAFVHLKNAKVSKFTRNLSPGSRTILLSGPAELYQQLLAKALANHYDAKLLLLDIADFSLKMQNKYDCNKKESVRISDATCGTMSCLISSFLRSSSKVMPEVKCASSWSFDEKLFVQALFKVLVSESDRNPIILYIRDIDHVLQSEKLYHLFSTMLQNLYGSIFVLGSRAMNRNTKRDETDERLASLFPYNIDIKAPDDESHVQSWDALRRGYELMKMQDHKNHIAEVLAANDLVCDDLASICHADAITLSNHLDAIVTSAVSYHLMNTKEPEYLNGKLVISSYSLSHGLSIFQEGKHYGKDKLENDGEKAMDGSAASTEASTSDNKYEMDNSLTNNAENSPPVEEAHCYDSPDNEFEKSIRAEMIPANEIGVKFNDIGALDEIKVLLQKLVMRPLRKPELFKSKLLTPCRGILLFGPPGTGKTMLAKALANEAGASFINVSMSTITSKWFGEDEKYVKALFTLARKVAPTIIFIDEVDSMLGRRTHDEHEAMRKIKNEFMTHWDGLKTKPSEHILVLAATNRPHDLDDAVIRRFERRIMVGLPTKENREKILRTILSEEKVENIDFRELATMTEGYTGSDLMVLCKAAAHECLSDFLDKESEKDVERENRAQEKKDSGESSNEETEEPIDLRALNMGDFIRAKNEVAASLPSEGSVMSELKQWNESYGVGGTRKKQQLTYFS